MNEEQIKQLIRQTVGEMLSSGKFSSFKTPKHTHNGTDSHRIEGFIPVGTGGPNNFINGEISIGAEYIGPSAMFPIPYIITNGGFSGGHSQSTGLMVVTTDTSTNLTYLFVNIGTDGQWRGVLLNEIP